MFWIVKGISSSASLFVFKKIIYLMWYYSLWLILPTILKIMGFHFNYIFTICKYLTLILYWLFPNTWSVIDPRGGFQKNGTIPFSYWFFLIAWKNRKIMPLKQPLTPHFSQRPIFCKTLDPRLLASPLHFHVVWSLGTNKTDRHDIAEILLKVVLNTITNALCFFYVSLYRFTCPHYDFFQNYSILFRIFLLSIKYIVNCK